MRFIHLELFDRTDTLGHGLLGCHLHRIAVGVVSLLLLTQRRQSLGLILLEARLRLENYLLGNRRSRLELLLLVAVLRTVLFFAGITLLWAGGARARRRCRFL